MLPIARVALAASVPLLLLALAGPWSRLRPPAALLVAAVAVGGGLADGVLLPTDLWTLPGLVGLGPEAMAMIAWGLYGGLAAVAGGLRLPGPPLVGAFLAGATMGELGAAAALAGSARDRHGAARLALAAMGGAVVGRIGDPAVLALSGRVHSVAWALVPLGIGMALVGAPRTTHVRPHHGSVAVTGVTAATALAGTLLPGALPWALGAGSLLLAVLAISARGGALFSDRELLGVLLSPFFWALGSTVAVLVATAGGVPHLGALGLELVVDRVGPWLLPGVAAASALLAALLDGSAAGLLLAALVDRAAFYRGDGLALAAMAGAASGGLGPLIIAGGLRAGWWRWLVQVAMAVGWAWVMTGG